MFAVGSAASPAVGGNALQAVVAVDGVVAAAGTAPPTDTLAATSAEAGVSMTPALVTLLAIGLVVFAATLAVGARRVRQD